MSAQYLAQSAYASARQTAHRTPRSVEYEVFARITARMRAALEDPKANFPALVTALHENRRLWTALAADVAESGNGLPEELRARLFYLAQFTREHSRKVLSGEDGADVLVEINAAVMRGLGQGRVSS